MTNKVWCDDIYGLNSSNTTFTYEHDSLYREYAATSIGDLIDKLVDMVKRLNEESEGIEAEKSSVEDQLETANEARDKVVDALEGSIALLTNARDILEK